MAWETRPNGRSYYYHPRLVGSRVEKAYFGKGQAAALMADAVADGKASREAEREAFRAYRARLEPLERVMSALDAGCGVVAAAALTAAGFHRHNRGTWRRKHGRTVS